MPTRRNKRKSGAGYLQPAEYFSPNARQPQGPAEAPSTAPIPGWARPVLAATGGKRNVKRNTFKGGFAPGLMGNFVSNAQSVIVPLVLYGLYNLTGSNTRKANSKTKSKSRR